MSFLGRNSLLLLIFCALKVNADVNVGFSQGYHLGMNNENINNFHPYFETNNNLFGILFFVNSYNRISVAPNILKKLIINENLTFTLRFGFTSGYRRKEIRSGIFVDDYLMFISPTIEYNLNTNNQIFINVLGNSVNLGYNYSL